MGKIAEWIWPEIRDLKNHIVSLKAQVQVQREHISRLEPELAEKTVRLDQLHRERSAYLMPKTPEVLKNVTAAQIRRMTEKEGERDV